MKSKANYMIIRKEYMHMLPTKALMAMDFVAVAHEDGFYEVLKNRFDDQLHFLTPQDFLEFQSKHLI